MALFKEDLETILGSAVLYRPDPEGLVWQLCRALDGQAGAAAAVGELLKVAADRGWEGNLWHCALTAALLEEDPFSLACERRPVVKDSLWQFALRDMELYHRLFRYVPEDQPLFPLLTDFHHTSLTGRPTLASVPVLAARLAAAETPEEMLSRLTDHYETYGLGMLGQGEIFRVREDSDGNAVLFPVKDRRNVRLSDLIGYEQQKELLLENTLAFLRGRHANNVLLYGDAGTGKSTSIQAIANEYAPQGLRLIELNKKQFGLIPSLLAQIKGRNYRFILFMDDLSFEENEVAYKHLKSVMEGGAEAAPENVRIYATSNRRHLVKETWNDRSDMEHNGDIHRSDTMEEKLSLAARFGLQIYYPNPSFEEYHTIIKALADRTPGLEDISYEELRSAAATWQVRHASRSGRTAQQFIDDLLCHHTQTP